uniref:CARD domain-containing protein n=1 Tax=Amphilophus citrinellus TaxID=61819 RepID=A0A3Q0RKG5_AMPCI
MRNFPMEVNEPVLNRLLDKLLEQRVITYEEMELVRSKSRADKVRDVIDMVYRKGNAAKSVLIASLCEADPYLSRELNLK